MKLSWSHYSRKSYQRNILEVYDTLVSYQSKKSGLCGLLGSRFNELLTKLTEDVPAPYGRKCYLKVRCREAEVIVFDRFYHAVLLSHVMKDFVTTVLAVYKDLDFQNAGKANDALCRCVLSKLEGDGRANNTIDVLQDKLSKMNPFASLGSNGLERNSDDLIQELQFSLDSTSDQNDYMEHDTFVEKAVQIFLDMV